MLTDIPNATIYYNTSSDTPASFDPFTGKPIFDVTESSITASLEENIEAGDQQDNFGANSVTLRLYGRLIEPTELPNEIVPRGTYRMEYTAGNGEIISGNFYLDVIIPDRLQLDVFFGTPIVGWFNY